jgi:bifunctional non-homologous end joining protein LigD
MAIFVVQEHHSTRLHWDFRLGIGGVLKSWAVPKGPSLDPVQRRLALQTGDLDLEHAAFEGIIPHGEYGAGAVLVWDSGTFEPLTRNVELHLQSGQFRFRLHGRILVGEFALIKLRRPGPERGWLLVKKDDEHAQPGWVTPILGTPARLRSLKVRALAGSVA